MSAQEILKMIEEVDPADTARLDEIDAHVSKFVADGYPKTEEFWDDNGWNERTYGVPRYTRSRDALKAIRPEGWSFHCWPNHCGAVSGHIKATYEDGIGQKHHDYFSVGSPHLTDKVPATEELAELHAIIQAIEHERGGK